MSPTDILLVITSNGMLLPVYRGGLEVAEGWPWTIRKLYTQALIISPSAERLSRVAQVSILGPYGSSALSRFFSVLNSNWRISIESVQTSMTLDEAIEAICAALQSKESMKQMLFDSQSGDLAARVRSAKSMSEVFEILGIGVNAGDGAALDSL